MKSSLLKNSFETKEVKDYEVVCALLTFMEDQASMNNFYLNVLVLSQVTTWKNTELEALIDLFENYIDMGLDYKDNRLLLSYNPLMSIALTADILTQIGKSKKRFEDKTSSMIEELLTLGNYYSAKIPDSEYYEDLILD